MKPYRSRFVVLLLISILLHVLLYFVLLLLPESIETPSGKSYRISLNYKHTSLLEKQLKEEPKKDSSKKEAPKKEAPKKEAPKKEAPKKEEPKKEEPKKEEPKKEEPKKEEPKKEEAEKVKVSKLPKWTVDIAEQTSSDNQSDKSITRITTGKLDADAVEEIKKIKQLDVNRRLEEKLQLKEKVDKTQVKEMAKIEELAPKQVAQKERIVTKGLSKITKSKEQDEKAEKLLIGDGAELTEIGDELPSYMDNSIFGEFDIETDEDKLALLELDFSMKQQGNLEILSDNRMNEVFAVQPYSELYSKKLELMNPIIRRIKGMVNLSFRYPPGKNARDAGKYSIEFIFDIDKNGYLEEVYISKTSGKKWIDKAYLDSILSIPDFRLFEHEILIKRFRNFKMTYFDDQTDSELMPFQTEQNENTQEN